MQGPLQEFLLIGGRGCSEQLRGVDAGAVARLTHGAERHGHGRPVDGAYESHERAEADHQLPAGRGCVLPCRRPGALGGTLEHLHLRRRQGDDLSLLGAILELLTVPWKASERNVRRGGRPVKYSDQNLSAMNGPGADPCGESTSRPSATSRVTGRRSRTNLQTNASTG